MAQKTYSAYTKDATRLLGATIRAERKQRKMTEQELADRTGVSRSFIKRLEKGDMSCTLGSAFEAAHVLGIQLFDMGPSRLASELQRTEEKLTLLPKAIRQKTKVIDDDF
ncbi:helix-turn-helix domain-containing protein [Kordiimonas pumila]|uniref:Helix-turn-helix domain-containing protein n=1 Tax=Kordiimonas pumila TaxID=2161677 RepID=A0ABV7D3C8_9PROT|nr:helix-turn-helix domain-containing protein [Kordiimonas pumila]